MGSATDASAMSHLFVVYFHALECQALLSAGAAILELGSRSNGCAMRAN